MTALSFLPARHHAWWLCALLSACASQPQPKPTVGATAPVTALQGAASTPSMPAAVPPGSAPPFDQVVKGADRQTGWLTVWKRQDKVWLELRPEDFGRPFFLSPRLKTGLGEAGLFGGLLASRFGLVGKPQWVEFRKLHQQVQLVAVNAAFRADPDTAQAQAVLAAFSPSLLGSTPIASAPHPQRNTVLIDLSSMMVGDLLGLGGRLNTAFRQGHGLDVRNSAVTQTQMSSTGLRLEVQQHFATANIATPTPTPGTPAVMPPSGLPDARSLLLTVAYTLSPLPADPAPTRRADPRVGYFATTVTDFSDDLSRSPRQRHIQRWRLEKQDPKAASSPPVRPLIYWLDHSIPTEYRPAIREGVLSWNAAFRAIGFENAIEVRDATAHEPQDMVGKGQAIIRWMTNHRPLFGAIGPTHVDPRTGEILTADIALESLSSRSIRTVRSQMLTRHDSAAHDESCQHADLAADQLGAGLSLLHDGRPLPPDSPEVKAFVMAYLKDVTMHEVGHTLGLRHNFRASRWRNQQELDNLALTQASGISASVMDYHPLNLNLPGKPAGTPFQTTLGPYDFWAIEYGYKPLEGDAAAQAQALRDIASRSQQPELATALAFGTDEDQGLGLDPQALTFDLGDDPVAFAHRRIALNAHLIGQARKATPSAEDEPAMMRRRVAYALRDMERVGGVLLRQVGGLITRRDQHGQRDLLDPLPAAQQRQALALLARTWLSPQMLDLSPADLRKMGPDYLERTEAPLDANGQPPATDFSMAEQLAVQQRTVLNALMADSLAERLLDNIDKSRDRESRPLTLRELHQTLRQAIWRQVPEDAATWQRNLQREHVNRLSIALLKGGLRADARAQVRQNTEALLSQLKGKKRSRNTDATSTQAAHLRDCIETLERALTASVQRTTP